MAINPSLVPTINPGDLFAQFTQNNLLNIRWLTAQDPAYFEVLNRPLYDITVRQLIVAKAMDAINTSMGYQALFPFVVPPRISDGSVQIDLPVRMFWDMHVSLPGGTQTVSWSGLRLARIDCLAGNTDLRLIFTAQQIIGGTTSNTETAVFYADYSIGSDLTYQVVRIVAATSATTPGLPVVGENNITIDGEVIFRTLDGATDPLASAFLHLVASGTGFRSYEIVDSVGSSDPDFSSSTLSHGTGLLTSSAYSFITPVGSDPLAWIEGFNYPFDIDATLTADDSSGVVIPRGMFQEFSLVAPAADQPTGDSSGTSYPVWISNIARDGSAQVPTLIFYFSTYRITPVNASQPVRFAKLVLRKDMEHGQVVAITPHSHLFEQTTDSRWQQEFGRGHVSLSSKWIDPDGQIAQFFDSFPLLMVDDPNDSTPGVTFGEGLTRITSWGLSRISKYTPTAGQAEALYGTAGVGRRTVPYNPSSSNRYVTELDEGLGEAVDLSSFPSTLAIDRYGYKATRAHALIKLVVDPEKASQATSGDFYATYILPRLVALLNRNPVFGDEWYNGNRFMKYNGDSWVG